MNQRTTGAVERGTLARLCLGYLAENPEQLYEFMTQVGYSPERLRAAVDSEELARGLIDYFASNEPLMLAFCANAGVSPEEFMVAWHRLNPEG